MILKKIIRKLTIAAAVTGLILLALTGCKDFSFFNELGVKGGLTITPASASILPGTVMTFNAYNGNGDYVFSIISGGNGSIIPATGVYTAPSTVPVGGCTDIVMVTDSTNLSATATIKIVDTLDELEINPKVATLSPGGEITFAATGGNSDSYEYSFQTTTVPEDGNKSGGTITSGGVYTAGPITGVTDTIIVTDANLTVCTVPANVDVVAATSSVNYAVTADTFPSSADAGTALSGTFTVTNLGTGNGGKPVSWWLYLSEDASFGGSGETLVASNNTGALNAGDSTTVTPTGTWPIMGGTYTLFIMVSAEDDMTHNDNIYEKTDWEITLTVPDVDYQVVSVAHSDPAPRYGQSFSGEFELANAGADDSTVLAEWEVWVSENSTIDAGDVKIDFGAETAPAMTAGELPYKLVSFTGTWPYGTGNSTDYYIIVQVSSSQDSAAGNDANNTADSGIVTVYQPQVNYDVSSVIHSDGEVAARTVKGSFQLDNIGSDDGSTTDVDYTVYASTNTGTPDATDTVVAFGTTAYISAGGTRTVDFSGTWPVSGDNYYLIVDISHPDDINDGDNVDWTAGSVSVRDVMVDYQAELLVSDVSGDKAGNDVSGDFTLTNNGLDDSLEEVEWSVYASTDTTLDVSDWLIQSATDPGALAASGSSTIHFLGTWPPVAGSYYLLVKITSAEDVISATTGNNLAVSLDILGSTKTPLPVAAPDVNYRVTSVSYVGGSKGLGGSFDGEFQYSNNGPDNGARPLEWAAYASLDDKLDAGDLCVGSGGSLVPLDKGASSGVVPFSGIWPYDFGEYYLFVEVFSQDAEVDPLDDHNFDSAFIAVGYYTETPELTSPFTDYNDDWTNLVNVDRFGVTLKPGTSLQISGNMSANDYDDIFEFPLDPLTTNVTVTATWASSPPNNQDVTLWFFIGPGGDDDGFGGYYVRGPNVYTITVVWTPDTLVHGPFPSVWIDLENSNLNNLGNTTITITAN